MSWEPDTEEIRLGKVRKELDDLKASTSFLNTSINEGMSSNALGVGFGVPSFNQGSNGDIPQQIENVLEDISGTFWGIVDVIGSLLVITDGGANEQVANQSTIRKLNGGVDGQKTVIKPALGKTVKLINNPNTNSSTDGNLLLGADLVLTDTESVTLRFTTDILYIDSYENNDPTATPPVIIQKIGGWIIESTGSGSGNSTSGVLKDPVKVASTGNNSLHPAWGSTIDGIGMVAGDRFLVKDQTTQADNGIYIWGTGALGVSVRASDMSHGSVQKEGTMTYVQDGLTQNERLYAIDIGGNSILIGTNPNTWGEIGSGGGGSSGSIKSPVKVATTADVTSWTYNNTSGTLTASGNGVVVIDGITLAVNNRILVKDQSPANENGIYSVTTAGAVGATLVLTRSTDMSTGSTIEGGTMVYVTDGTVNGDNLFGLTTEGTVTVGTGNQAWANLTVGGANTALSNLALTTSINSDLTMQNGFSIANLERVAFNTRTSSSIAGSISYDGTDIFAKGSGAEINLTSGFPTLTGNNIFSGINTFSQSIVAGGAGEGMTTIGHLDFVNNSATPVATVSLYSDGTDLFSTTNIDLNNKDLKSVDDIFFHTSGISINTDSVGMVLQVPAGDTIDFLVDGSRMTLSETVLDIKLPTTMTTNDITFTTGDLTMGTGEIIAGGAQKEIRNIGELVFVDNTISPAGNGIIYFNGTDVKVKTGGNTVNLTNVSGANFTDATFRITDELDLTKKFAFDVGSISTGTVRTMTIPDADINMGGLTNSNLATGTFGSITGVGSQSQSLNMNNNDIIAVSGLDLDGSTATIEGVANLNFYHTNRNINSVTGTMDAIAYSVNTNEKHSFQVAGSEVLTIATGDIDFIGDLDMHTYDITSVDRLKLSTVQGSGTALLSTDTGIEALYSGVNPFGMLIQFPSTNGAVMQIKRGTTDMINISSLGVLFGDELLMGGHKISNVLTPTASSAGTDVATKDYVLANAGGSQTPWTSTINADNNPLIGANYIQFNNLNQSVNPSNTVPFIQFDNYDMTFNIPTGKGYEININGSTIMSVIDTTVSVAQGTKIQVNTSTARSGFKDVGTPSDPTTSSSGDMYYNSTSNEYKFYNGSSWNTFGGSSSGGGVNNSWIWTDDETNEFDEAVYLSNAVMGRDTQTTNAVLPYKDTVYWVPMYFSKACTINAIGLQFTTAGTGSMGLMYGLYDTYADQNYPKSLIDGGSSNLYMGTGVGGNYGLTTSFAIPSAGLYFIAIKNDTNTGSAFRVQGGGSTSPTPSLGHYYVSGTSNGFTPITGYFSTEYGNLPSTPDDDMSVTHYGGTNIPLIFLRVS